ncbi:RICIN domain-containing protein [Leucobacter viscericola]|uniref:RICIN domain-containing protein n=1 Tax=Leucobacter viscericola TaxID=2714935 RepID=A0A6G7XIP0_9MICO|nr:RICIN domain-containing protein [Leucobacter viscericola]QIK64382.1 RICIN domain-containing protein [Leucobacter viscericola]
MAADQHKQLQGGSWIARSRVPTITGFVTLLLLISGGTAWAYWSTQVTANASLHTERVRVVEKGFSDLSADYTPSGYSHTGSFTIKNTGDIAGQSAVNIAATGELAAALKITIWETAASQNCTNNAQVPGVAFTGTWAAPPSIARSIAAGEEASYCLRSFASDPADIASPSGAQSFTSEMTVTLTAKGWLSTTPPSTNLQQTIGIFPPTPNFYDPTLSRWFEVHSSINSFVCLGASWNQSTLYNLPLRSYACAHRADRRWEFVPVNGQDQSFVTIRSRNVPRARVFEDYDGWLSLKTPTAAITASQQWRVHEDKTTVPSTFKFVNAVSGLCLGVASVNTNDDVYTVSCDAPQARVVLIREPLTFTEVHIQGVSPYRIGFSDAQLPATRYLERWTGSSWESVSFAINGDTYIPIPLAKINAFPPGESSYRIIDSEGQVLWDSIKLVRDGSTLTPTGGFG